MTSTTPAQIVPTAAGPRTRRRGRRPSGCPSWDARRAWAARRTPAAGNGCPTRLSTDRGAPLIVTWRRTSQTEVVGVGHDGGRHNEQGRGSGRMGLLKTRKALIQLIVLIFMGIFIINVTPPLVLTSSPLFFLLSYFQFQEQHGY